MLDHNYSSSVCPERGCGCGSRCPRRWYRDHPPGWGSLIRVHGVEISPISPPVSGKFGVCIVSEVSNEHTRNIPNLVELERYEGMVLVGFVRG